jgi:hypothetical protein
MTRMRRISADQKKQLRENPMYPRHPRSYYEKVMTENLFSTFRIGLLSYFAFAFFRFFAMNRLHLRNHVLQWDTRFDFRVFL